MGAHQEKIDISFLRIASVTTVFDLSSIVILNQTRCETETTIYIMYQNMSRKDLLFTRTFVFFEESPRETKTKTSFFFSRSRRSYLI
jgi:hypothetical protein